ncbi:MAG TPA: cation:proton antiporter [Candidatus Limnocylindrales bacterium]|nr:cation:proton antiporter [Candidatus Limnocylindrales bacterium]
MTLPSGPEWNFLVLLVVIATGPFVAERLRLPGIIGLLIGGFLISGHGLGLLTSEAFVEVVGELGLLYLMFLAGAELDLGLFERLRRKAVVFGLLTFALPFILGLILALWLEFEPLAAILIGSLWASHTLVTYPIIRRFGLTSDPAVAISVGATVITDTLALVVLAVVSKAETEGSVGLATFVSLGVGLAVLTLASFLVVPRIARWFFAGLGMNRLLPHGSPLAERVEFFGSALFVPAFLVSVGLVIDPSVLFQPATIRLAMVFLVAVTVGKLGAALIGGRLFGFTTAQAGVMFSLTYSQAAATLAAATVGVEIGLFGTDVLNAIIVVIMVSLFVASLSANRFAARVPPASEVTADLGHAIVVPLDDPALAPPALSLAARIAEPDGGLVVPIHIVGPQDRPGLAIARKTAAAIDAAARTVGIEAEPSLRVAVSPGQGIRNAVAAANGTLLILVRGPGLAAQDVMFGGIDSEHVAGSNVPTIVAIPSDARIARVVMPIRKRDVAPEGLIDVRLAVETAARLVKGDLDLVVGLQRGANLPADVTLPDDARRVDFDGGRVGWIRETARPGDLVLLPAGLETLVIGLDASRLGSLPGVTVAVIAGPYRSAAYVGNRESIGAIETAAI